MTIVITKLQIFNYLYYSKTAFIPSKNQKKVEAKSKKLKYNSFNIFINKRYNL